MVMNTLGIEVAVGDGSTTGGLTVFPLFGTTGSEETAAYITARVALDAGLLDVSEVDAAATVSDITVTNRAPVPALFVEGETIIGLKQNRVINVSVLVPAQATEQIPVSCVEARRWGTPAAAGVSRFHVPAGLRARKVASVQSDLHLRGGHRSDQAGVWRDVDAYMVDADAPAPTAALEDVFAHRRDELEDLISAVRPEVGQVGVLAMWGGGHAALDLFDSPGTLEEYWDSILSGYSMDAIREPPTAYGKHDAAELLEALSSSRVSRHDAVGEGTEVNLVDEPDGLRQGLTASALEWQGRIVHMAAFADLDRR